MPNLYTLEDLREGKARNMLAFSIRNNRLVPIVCSGFTSGLEAKNGIVPDIRGWRKALADILVSCDIFAFEERQSLEELLLSDLVQCFCDSVFPSPGSPYADDLRVSAAQKAFMSYVTDNLTCIKGITPSMLNFVQCGWRYIYTTSLDDTLDEALSREYESVGLGDDNRFVDTDGRFLIRLRGGVRRFIASGGNPKTLILDGRQYLQSISNMENRAMCRWLQDDLSSKDLLLIGCDLTGDGDSPFAEYPGLRGLSRASLDCSFYVYFDSSTDAGLSIDMQVRLRRWGFSNVIRLKPDERDEFFQLVSELYVSERERNAEGGLDRYTGFEVSYLPVRSTSVDSLFCNLRPSFGAAGETPKLVLPSFTVKREVTRRMLGGINRGVQMSIMYGRRFCGKTYALIELVDALQRSHRDVYFFSGVKLSDETVRLLSTKRNCVLVFDSDTVESSQIDMLLSEGCGKQAPEKAQMIFAVNRSDKYLLESLMRRHTAGGVNFAKYPIESRLSSQELDNFNDGIKKLGIILRRPEETFLDFAMRVAESGLLSGRGSLPDYEFLEESDQAVLVAMIALAVDPVMRVDVANRLGITEALGNLCEKYDSAVQTDYLELVELTAHSHAGAKYVTNSIYWMAMCLSYFSRNTENHPKIARAMYEIVSRLEESMSPSTPSEYSKYYRHTQPYVYQDTIEDVFFIERKWPLAGELLACIYDELNPLLCESYQFLHQRAKCDLRRSAWAERDEKLILLGTANQHIERALEIAQESNSTNIVYSLAHMHVTRAFILTAYLRSQELPETEKKKRLEDAIDSYYYALVEHSDCVDDRLLTSDWEAFYWLSHALADWDGELRPLLSNASAARRVGKIFTSNMGERWKELRYSSWL